MGFGTSSFGTFPFGFGAPTITTKTTRPVHSARKLDVNSKDFVADSDGNLEGMPPVRQRVLLALTTTLGSSAVLPTFGNAVRKIKTVDASLKVRVRNYVKLALRRLAEIEQVIRIDAIEVEEKAPGNVVYSVFYTDLTTATPDEVSVGL